jgi:hypothetical protein
MTGNDFQKMGRQFFPLLARTSGFVTSGQSLAANSEEGFVMFLLWGFLGAFCGLVCGLMVSQLARYVGFLMGRNLGGLSWSIGGALLGAAAFAWLATTDKED